MAETERAALGLDALWTRAERQVPGWVAINARLPQRLDGPVTFFIHEPKGWHLSPRSQLVLDPATWTRIALAWRRLRTWRRRAATRETLLEPRQEVSAD